MMIPGYTAYFLLWILVVPVYIEYTFQTGKKVSIFVVGYLVYCAVINIFVGVYWLYPAILRIPSVDHGAIDL